MKVNKPIDKSGLLQRIVCLSHESVEMLVRLGCADIIVGRPSGNRLPEMDATETIGGYGSVNLNKVMDLKPDIVISYSDFHSQIAAELIQNHLNVLALNHTDIAGIFKSIRILGGIVQKVDEAEALIVEMHEAIASFKQESDSRRHPTVYFEEWDSPLITGTKWVSEMIEIAGGQDVFKGRSEHNNYLEREVSLTEVVEKDPEIIFASWCGKNVKFDRMRGRNGWSNIRAVANNHLYELPGEIVLQPGPSIIEGIALMQEILLGEKGE